VLLGKDIRLDTGWSDFSGKMERIDKSCIISTACREFTEETLGLLYDPRSLRRYISPETAVLLRGRTQNGFQFYCFAIEIPYMPSLAAQYRRVCDFLLFRNLHRQLVEKTDLAFLPASKLFDPTFPKRSVFCATIATNAAVLRDIVRAIETGENWRDLCARHAHEPWDLN
jgi:hypothetical protein